MTAKSSSIPTDEKYGQEAEEIAGAAIDNYVQYKRELHILVESDQDVETLKTRALTEARRRAAKGLTIDLTLSIRWISSNPSALLDLQVYALLLGAGSPPRTRKAIGISHISDL